MNAFVLARHAESEFNCIGLINADPRIPNPLTAEGRRQAERLGELLADGSLDLCATSGLPRAVGTADIALRGRSVPRLVLPDLNTPRAGDLEGGPVAAYLAFLDRHGPAAPYPGGGESQFDGLRRYLRALRLLLDRQEPRILIVSHDLPIGWLREGLAVADGRRDLLRVDFRNLQVDFAVAYPFTAEDVRRSLDVLDRELGASRERAGPA